MHHTVIITTSQCAPHGVAPPVRRARTDHHAHKPLPPLFNLEMQCARAHPVSSPIAAGVFARTPETGWTAVGAPQRDSGGSSGECFIYCRKRWSWNLLSWYRQCVPCGTKWATAVGAGNAVARPCDCIWRLSGQGCLCAARGFYEGVFGAVGKEWVDRGWYGSEISDVSQGNARNERKEGILSQQGCKELAASAHQSCTKQGLRCMPVEASTITCSYLSGIGVCRRSNVRLYLRHRITPSEKLRARFGDT